MANRALSRVIAGGLAGASLAALLLMGAATATADESNPSASTTATPSAAPASPAVEFPLRPGDEGALIAVLHDRLQWLGYSLSKNEVTGQTYGPSTQRALTALQQKFWLPMDRYVTQKSWDRIRGIAGPIGKLPQACTSKESICISTKQKLVRWVSNGKVEMSADARFGMPETATARGTFSVARKSRNHVSSLYRTAMPYSLFFHGGQAVHYSAYFKRDGYYGASHGCVNLRDLGKAASLFNRAQIGTRVHVY